MDAPVLPHRSHHLFQQAGERLRAQYARHQSTAAFWDAYQQIQAELTAEFPELRTELCNRLAVLAQRLGAVEQAQLLDPLEIS